MLSDNRFTILKNAAARGHAHAGVAEDWEAGIARLVKSAQRPGESYESAYARATAGGEGLAFLDCLRKAQDTEAAQRRGRPRQHQPGAVKRGAIETALADAAMAVAKARGISYESGFALVLDTPAGQDLYAALRQIEAEGAI